MAQAVHRVVDAHHHLWSLQEFPQTWMAPTGMEAIQRDFTEEAFAAEAGAHGVVASVVVQSVHDSRETGRLIERASRQPIIEGVVGWADLKAPDLADQVAAWRALAGGHRLVGLRHLVSAEPVSTLGEN